MMSWGLGVLGSWGPPYHPKTLKPQDFITRSHFADLPTSVHNEVVLEPASGRVGGGITE